MRSTRLLALALACAVAAGCGGGGGSSGGGAVSGRVPYLLSAPTVTFLKTGLTPTSYDITVTLEADGPTGVAFADVYLEDTTNTTFAFIDLKNIVGTKRWRGSTNTFMLLPAGNYIVREVMLHDEDPLSQNPIRTGWYIQDVFFSTSTYFVDERQVSYPGGSISIDFYNWGVSAIPISRFTLP